MKKLRLTALVLVLLVLINPIINAYAQTNLVKNENLKEKEQEVADESDKDENLETQDNQEKKEYLENEKENTVAVEESEEIELKDYIEFSEDQTIDDYSIIRNGKHRKIVINAKVKLKDVYLKNREIIIKNGAELILDAKSGIDSSDILNEGKLIVEEEEQVENIYRDNNKLNKFKIILSTPSVKEKEEEYLNKTTDLIIDEGKKKSFEFVEEDGKTYLKDGQDSYRYIDRIVNKGQLELLGNKSDGNRLNIINEKSGKLHINAAKLYNIEIENHGSVKLDNGYSLKEYNIINQGSFEYIREGKSRYLKKGTSNKLSYKDNLEEKEEDIIKDDNKIVIGEWDIDKNKTISIYMKNSDLIFETDNVKKKNISRIRVSEKAEIKIKLGDSISEKLDLEIENKGKIKILKTDENSYENFVKHIVNLGKGSYELEGKKVIEPRYGGISFFMLKEEIESAKDGARIDLKNYNNNVEFTDTITIDKDIEIVGDGQTLLSVMRGKDLFRHFDIKPGAKVTIKDINFLGGQLESKSYDHEYNVYQYDKDKDISKKIEKKITGPYTEFAFAGGINNQGDLYIENCKFVQIRSTYGAILNGSTGISRHGNLEIKDTDFIENEGRYSAGIINNSFNKDSLVSLNGNIKFINSDYTEKAKINIKDYEKNNLLHGRIGVDLYNAGSGSLEYRGNPGEKLEIHGERSKDRFSTSVPSNIFFNDSAAAILNEADDGKLIIDGDVFISNNLGYESGGYNDATDAILSKGFMEIAAKDGSLINKNGGLGLYNIGQAVLKGKIEFNANKQGAIMSDERYHDSWQKQEKLGEDIIPLILKGDMEFNKNGNLSTSLGANQSGAILSGTPLLMDGNFKVHKNEKGSSIDGTGIAISYRKNSQYNDDKYAIDLKGKYIFSQNRGYESGGAISATGSYNRPYNPILNLDGDFEFIGNNVERDGRTIAGAGGAIAVSRLKTNGNFKFIENRATYQGGAIMVSDSWDAKGNYSFDGNYSDKTGGAIYLANGSDNIDSKLDGKFVFKNNTSNENGGAAYLMGRDIELKGDYDFINNRAGTTNSADGGAIYIQYGNIGLNGDFLFDSNRSNNAGGAIYYRICVLAFRGNMDFKNNYSLSSGGAIANSDNEVSAIDKEYVLVDGKLNFEKNGARLMGGAISGQEETSRIREEGKNIVTLSPWTINYKFVDFKDYTDDDFIVQLDYEDAPLEKAVDSMSFKDNYCETQGYSIYHLDDEIDSEDRRGNIIWKMKGSIPGELDKDLLDKGEYDYPGSKVSFNPYNNYDISVGYKSKYNKINQGYDTLVEDILKQKAEHESRYIIRYLDNENGNKRLYNEKSYDFDDEYELIDIPDDYEGKGKKFVGWAKAGKEYKPGDKLAIDKDQAQIITYEAVWEKESCTLRFIDSEKKNDDLEIKTYVGDVVYLPNLKNRAFTELDEDDNKNYYIFRNWKDEKENYFYPGNRYKVQGDMTFVSEWENLKKRHRYEIRFIDYRSRVNVDNIGGLAGDVLKVPDIADIRQNGMNEDNSLKKDIEYKGHEYECINGRYWTFLYWIDENGDKYFPGDDITIVGDNILRAVWENTTDYKVQFKYIAKDGQEKVKELEPSFNVGDIYSGAAIPEDLKLDENEKFRGWKNEVEGSILNPMEDREVYIYDVNPIVYHAELDKEDKPMYTIRFIDKFGRNNMDDRRVLAGTLFTIPGAECLECMQGIKAYDFKKWRLEPEELAKLASLKNFVSEAELDNPIVNNQILVNRDMDFHAVWVEKPYFNVSYKDEENQNEIDGEKLYIDQRLLIPNPIIKEFEDKDYKYSFKEFQDSKGNSYTVGKMVYLRDNFALEDLAYKDIELRLVWTKTKIDSGGGDSGGGGGGSGGGGGGGGSDRPEKPDKPEKPEKPDEDIKIEDQINREDHYSYIKGYKDGLVRPLGNTTREEFAAMVARTLNKDFIESFDEDKLDSNFSDVSKDRWSKNYIDILSSLDIAKGYKDNTFRPGNKITRAEVATVIYRINNLDPGYEHNILDISKHWAEKYIAALVKLDWVEGYTDKTFRPNEYISRAEAVTIMNNMLRRYTKEENMLSIRKEFPDLTKDKWYYEHMQEAINGHNYKIEDGNEIWTELVY